MITIDSAKLRGSTKRLMGLALGFGTVMQVPAVNGLVYGLTKAHPHVAAVLTSMVSIALLLHNPEVQAALGIKQTVEVKTEEVTLAAPVEGAR